MGERDRRLTWNSSAHGAYEDRGKAVPGVPVATDFLKKKDGKTFFVLNDFAQEVDSLLSVKDMLYKGIVGFINHKLREYPVSVGYVADAKGVRAYQVASSLASHMWSMYAQGVFNDTPNGREQGVVFCVAVQWISKYQERRAESTRGCFIAEIARTHTSNRNIETGNQRERGDIRTSKKTGRGSL
jgi:hypothetical protein